MTITIDGKQCVCEPGEYILDIAARNGIEIPTLCNHGGLTGQGCCRVCIVEVDVGGKRSIVTACIYPVEQECAVFTDNENVARQRGMVLSLLQALAPESSEVSQLCEVYGAPEHERFTVQDGNKCILCGLCVKACQSLGTGAISTIMRGIEKVVSTPYNEPSAVCVGCASCAAVCTTRAIEVEEKEQERTIWNKSFPIKMCENCGCPMGTYAELRRCAEKIGAEFPKLCDSCKKKSIADVLVGVYGCS